MKLIKITVYMLLILLITGCGNKDNKDIPTNLEEGQQIEPNETMDIDWVDCFRYNGITYEINYSSEVTTYEVGKELGEIIYTISEDNDINRILCDNEATYLPVGTKFYAIIGYKETFRLIVVSGTQSLLYEVSRNPSAKVGGEYFDFNTKVSRISINSDYDLSELVTVEEVDQDIIIQLINTSIPQEIMPQIGGEEERYFIVVHFNDGSQFELVYWPNHDYIRGFQVSSDLAVIVNKYIEGIDKIESTHLEPSLSVKSILDQEEVMTSCLTILGDKVYTIVGEESTWTIYYLDEQPFFNLNYVLDDAYHEAVFSGHVKDNGYQWQLVSDQVLIEKVSDYETQAFNFLEAAYEKEVGGEVDIRLINPPQITITSATTYIAYLDYRINFPSGHKHTVAVGEVEFGKDTWIGTKKLEIKLSGNEETIVNLNQIDYYADLYKELPMTYNDYSEVYFLNVALILQLLNEDINDDALGNGLMNNIRLIAFKPEDINNQPDLIIDDEAGTVKVLLQYITKDQVYNRYVVGERIKDREFEWHFETAELVYTGAKALREIGTNALIETIEQRFEGTIQEGVTIEVNWLHAIYDDSVIVGAEYSLRPIEGGNFKATSDMYLQEDGSYLGYQNIRFRIIDEGIEVIAVGIDI